MHEKLPPYLPFPAEHPTLIHALAQAVTMHGASKIIAEDILKTPLTYQKFWWRMELLAGALKPALKDETYIGILLPTSLGGSVSFFALHRLGKIPVMLNFSAGEPALKAAVEMVPLKRVITSRAFIEKAQLEHVITFLSPLVEIVYLEDVRERIHKIPALIALLKLKIFGIQLDSSLLADSPPEKVIAVILFTSGSEGLPKGVALSHKNILSNIAQVNEVLSFTEEDVMLNAMPIFHSFGLVAGMILPLLLGIRVFLYPSPLHYKQIPKLCKSINASILLGTDTFLRGYANAAHEHDFKSLRFIVAGAEKLKEPTSELYQKRFGIEIMQGYGVTETSPVLSCNAPETNIRGTTGKLMPHMEAKLVPVEGIADGGALHVKGPNIMLGYMKHEKPGVLQPAAEWYDTGDIVTIDAKGYIRIIGRLKRFAKIGGEMVSLAVVEEAAQQISPEHAHAAIATPDERKGEQITLYSEDKTLTREALVAHMKAQGLSELYSPKRVVTVEALPRLGNGKLDYPAIGKL